MLLFRLLLLLGIAFIGWRMYRLLKARRLRGEASARLQTEDMVECAHCALRVPRSQAVAAEGRWFCCELHRRSAGHDAGPGDT